MGRGQHSLVWLTLGVAALATAQGVRESVRVGLVTVRLDVRGRDGRPLEDLKASDVKLRVDGKDVAIEGVDRVAATVSPTGPVPGTAGVPAARQDAPSPAARETAGASTPLAASHADLYLAILVDETASNSFDRRDVYRQIESFLSGRMGPGVHVMLERFDGRLQTECTWTTDAARLLAAAKRMSKRTFDSRMPSPSALADEISNGRKARDIELQVDQNARRSFEGMLQALIQFPSEVPGRKGLVLVTDGTPLMTPFDLSLMLSGSNSRSRDSLSMKSDYLRNHGDQETAKQIDAMLQDEALSTLAVFGAAPTPPGFAAWRRSSTRPWSSTSPSIRSTPRRPSAAPIRAWGPSGRAGRCPGSRAVPRFRTRARA